MVEFAFKHAAILHVGLSQSKEARDVRLPLVCMLLFSLIKGGHLGPCGVHARETIEIVAFELGAFIATLADPGGCVTSEAFPALAHADEEP